MEIVRVEPTPSPNTMKIVLSEKREDNKSNTYTTVKEGQPQFINDLLALDDVKSIFHVMDFLAVDKQPKADWEEVLPQITSTLNDEIGETEEATPDEHFGEIQAEVLMFKGIPYQIKLTNNEEEKRKQLPEVYVDSMLAAQKENDNVVFLRKWEDFGIRYGEFDDIMSEISDEITAMYPQEQLDKLVSDAQATDIVVPEKVYTHVTLEEYNSAENWKDRLRMLKQFPTPTLEDLPLLGSVLSDEEKAPLRREAVVLLGMLEDEQVLPYLYKGLKALPEMEKALDDPQKIVRWRAAMFLFDEGGPEQLDSLKAHIDDNAYEVKLQIEMAISRIENGDEALGSVWKQIANRNNK
jgi:hypothetical protein